jgi:hypothetical protein
MRIARVAILLVTITLVAGSQGLAQMMTLGVKGGVTVSNVTAKQSGASVDTDNRTGFNVAGVLSMEVSPIFAVEVDGQLVKKGFGISDTTSGITSGLDLLYLNFPILAMVTVPAGPDRLIAARLFAGPSFGFRITCDIVPYEGQTGTGVCDPQQAKSFDFGVTAGAGIKVGKGPGGLILDVSFDYGLGDINKSDDLSVKNRALSVSVGYLFSII